MPNIPSKEFVRSVLESDAEEATKRYLVGWATKMLQGLPFIEHLNSDQWVRAHVENLHLSECYNCRKISVWVHDRLVFPGLKGGAAPNEGMPDDVRLVFEEARSILGGSARGAAALLRLCIQMLCIELGEKGKKIDDDIASLVSKGLSVVVQQSLDIVRVIGNDSVHPGVIDINDDRKTAEALFDLVNSITEQMITQPKAVAALYEKLPESKRKAIEARDAKAKK